MGRQPARTAHVKVTRRGACRNFLLQVSWQHWFANLGRRTMSDIRKTRVTLVTGGSGYVGSHVCVELLEGGHNVLVIDNCVNCKEGANEKSLPPAIRAIDELTNDSGSELHFERVDIRDRAALAKLFDTYDIETVVHMAALKDVHNTHSYRPQAIGKSVKMPLEYYSANVCGTLSLLEVMRAHGCNRLIVASSATVYGAPQYLPLDEKHPTGIGQTSPYGRSKYFVEQIIKDLHVAEPSWQIVMLRHFNPVGAHKSGVIGEDPLGVPENLMPSVAQVTIGSQAMVMIHGDDYATEDGTGVRDYIHVVDVARAYTASIKALDKLKRAGGGLKVYNVGRGEGVSVLEMIYQMEDVSDEVIGYEIGGRRFDDLPTCYASAELAQKELGWKPTYSLHDMCADLWNWQKKNPDGFGLTDVEPDK